MNNRIDLKHSELSSIVNDLDECIDQNHDAAIEAWLIQAKRNIKIANKLQLESSKGDNHRSKNKF